MAQSTFAVVGLSIIQLTALGTSIEAEEDRTSGCSSRNKTIMELALLRAVDRKRNVVGIKEIEFDNKKQRMMQAKAFGRNVGAFKVYINWATGMEIYTPSEHCFERINR